MVESATPRGWLRRFGVIWLGQAGSLVGSSLAHFALVWWVTETTGSATILATASLVAMLPEVLLGPFAGALVDRWNRRRVMVVADTVVALASAWLAWLLSQGSMEIWHIYAALVIRSLGGSFHWPAMTASTSMMVPKEHLARVSGANQAIRGVVQVAAPPLGALLLSLLPLHSIMLIDVATAALAITPLLLVAIPQPKTTVSDDSDGLVRAVWRDVRAGVAYVRAWRSLGAMILLATAVNLLLGPAFSLLPLLVTDHFGGGATELAGVQSAFGFGIVAGGLLLSVWGGFRKRVHTVVAGIVGTGVGMLILVSVPPALLVVGLGGVLFGGVMNSLCNGAIMAVVQERVDHAVQGRVMTVLHSLAGGMMPIGLAIVGPLADLVGVRPVMFWGAVAQTLLGVAAFGWRTLMALEDEDPTPQPAAQMEVA